MAKFGAVQIVEQHNYCKLDRSRIQGGEVCKDVFNLECKSGNGDLVSTCKVVGESLDQLQEDSESECIENMINDNQV